MLKQRNETDKMQHKKLEKLVPIARKPAKVSNYKFMCAKLYIIENCCKWRTLQNVTPKKIVNSLGYTINKFINNEILPNDIFLV